MENQNNILLLTRDELWSSFGENQSPLETAILAKEKLNGKIVQSLCYTSTMFNSEKVRAYLQLYSSENANEAMPTVLILPNAGYNPNYSALIDALVDKGYCVCLLDYAGIFDFDLYQTRFPSSLKYAQHPFCRNSLATLHGNTVKDTAWYHWMCLIKRCLAVLKTNTLVDYDKLSIIGYETGADLSWIIAGEEKKLSAVIPIGGGGAICKSRPSIPEESYDAEAAANAFAIGVSAEIYAKTMSADLLFIPFTNSRYFPFSYANDIFSIATSKNKQILVDVNLGKQLSQFSFDYLLHWLDAHYANRLIVGKEVSTSVEVKNDELYFNLISNIEPTAISLFYSYGDKPRYNSLWIETSQYSKINKNTYSLSIPVEVATIPINYFATLSYENGLKISTPLGHVVPAKQGLVKTNSTAQRSDHILYASRLDFCPFRAETNSIVLADDVLKIKESPQKIKGITVQDGSLYIPKTSDMVSFVSSSSMLSCDLYTEKEKTLTFSFYTCPNFERYSYTVEVSDLTSWQKLVLKVSDFKSSEGKGLNRLNEGFIFYIEHPDGCLFNNIILI